MVRLEEQHEPRSADVLVRLTGARVDLAGVLRDELQGLRPLVINAACVRRPLRQDGVAAIRATRASRLIPCKAPAGADCGLLPGSVRDLRDAAIELAAGAVTRKRGASEPEATDPCPGCGDASDSLAGVVRGHDCELGDVQLETACDPDCARAAVDGRGPLEGLPFATDPDHQLRVTRHFWPSDDLYFDARNARHGVRRRTGTTADDDAGLEQADRELHLVLRRRAVSDLRVEVRIQVTIADATECCTTTLLETGANRANAEQRHVIEDVLAVEQTQFTTREELRAVLEPDRQVHLAHVDKGAELVVGVTIVLNLWRKPDVYAEVQPAFLTLRVERRECRQQTGAHAAVSQLRALRPAV